MHQNTLIYKGKVGKGSKITRDLVRKFFHALASNLSDKSFLEFVTKSRVPNERELYGIFVKSILESCEKDLGHIATEFQVARGEDSKGRVDLLFNYRSVSYLVELKVGRVNARDDDKEPKIRAQKIWRKAIEQLDELDVRSDRSLLKVTIVKLPIVLYFFDSRKMLSEQDNHKAINKKIFDFIMKDADGNEISELEPDFELYSPIPCTPTRLRKTGLHEKTNTHLYGFSIFAKQVNS